MKAQNKQVPRTAQKVRGARYLEGSLTSVISYGNGAACFCCFICFLPRRCQELLIGGNNFLTKGYKRDIINRLRILYAYFTVLAHIPTHIKRRTTMYKILIIEDNRTIANAVKNHLEKWGFEAKCAENFKDTMSEFFEYSPHLVLMDIGLPFYNGFYRCSEIRRVSNVPVVFLSSASDNMNIVMAMNMGGDDFISKPFDLTVLMAKIQAILRRTYDFGSDTNVISHKGAMLNISDASLSFNGEKIDLTKNEYRIMLTLLENKGKVVSRDFLMNKLWETDCYVDENTLTVNVSRLRKKLEKSGLTDFIETKPGMGYMVE